MCKSNCSRICYLHIIEIITFNSIEHNMTFTLHFEEKMAKKLPKTRALWHVTGQVFVMLLWGALVRLNSIEKMSSDTYAASISVISKLEKLACSF